MTMYGVPLGQRLDVEHAYDVLRTDVRRRPGLEQEASTTPISFSTKSGDMNLMAMSWSSCRCVARDDDPHAALRQDALQTILTEHLAEPGGGR